MVLINNGEIDWAEAFWKPMYEPMQNRLSGSTKRAYVSIRNAFSKDMFGNYLLYELSTREVKQKLWWSDIAFGNHDDTFVARISITRGAL